MRIGALSQRTGVSERLLRYYEEQGLLRPLRRPSGYREYGEEDVRTVRSIRTLLAAGLNTRVIAELLPCMYVDGEGDQLAPACPGMLPDLERERARIDAAMADLAAAREVLETVIAATPPRDAEEPEACGVDGPVVGSVAGPVVGPAVGAG
ncbi:MerR family transcriptional regulator [Streptomyces sp. BA2]|uniref:MerR family transcriptional regulator n=1 Tax=Streptomyces sp. BA2 TaxID=436595 RepID=UPI001325F7AB|nr:MerR family transcriptional regulator [Streptomyces sp. BA2]MWA11801.1 MerR family transcriptional regulator [Streptomyces sp. BA2]